MAGVLFQKAEQHQLQIVGGHLAATAPAAAIAAEAVVGIAATAAPGATKPATATPGMATMTAAAAFAEIAVRHVLGVAGARLFVWAAGVIVMPAMASIRTPGVFVMVTAAFVVVAAAVAAAAVAVAGFMAKTA